MGEIEWAMWANEQAIISAAVLLIGGIVGVAGLFNNWEFAAYSIPAAVLIILIEYPRSKRKKGNTVERKFQHVFVPVINAFGPVTKNYYVRCIIHVVLCVPTCFVLPTVLGGMCLIITAIIYLVAAIKGEEWRPMGNDKKASQSQAVELTMSKPPSKPPPRAPQRQSPQSGETSSTRAMSATTSSSMLVSNQV